MILHDMNQSWKAPKDYTLQRLNVEGAFLVVTYQQTHYEEGTMVPMGYATVQIYVNDQGREVMRTQDFTHIPKVADWSHVTKLSRWARIELWFRTSILGE